MATTMVLQAREVTITDQALIFLKNFKNISNSIILHEGDRQQVVDRSVAMIAIAKFHWPQETGIWDLNTFLGTLSLFKKPTMVLDGPNLVIKEEQFRIDYHTADPSTIANPAIKEEKFDIKNPLATFTLSQVGVNRLNKASLLAPTHILFEPTKTGVTLVARNTKDPLSHTVNYTPKEVQGDVGNRTNPHRISYENFTKMLDGSYEVKLGNTERWVVFTHQELPIRYIISEDLSR